MTAIWLLACFSKAAILQIAQKSEGFRTRVIAELEEIDAAVQAGVNAIHRPSSPRAASELPGEQISQQQQPAHQEQQPSSTQDSNPTPEQLQMLNKLSTLSGISNDKLAHEL